MKGPVWQSSLDSNFSASIRWKMLVISAFPRFVSDARDFHALTVTQPPSDAGVPAPR